MSFEIEVESGSSVRLPTAGKYCDRDIVVTAAAAEGSYDEGYAAGQQAEYDRFWDSYQQETRTSWDYAFYGIGWTDETYKPKHPIVGSIPSAFRGGKFTNTIVPIVVKGSTTNAFTFSAVVTIPSIDLTEATNTASCFNNASKLVNVTFAGTIPTSLDMSDCPLTNASVQSVIDHLKDLTGATTQTLTLKASVGAEMTEAQKAAISAKNWTLVY